MKFEKKSISSHILILLIVTFIMGSFVFVILGVFYGDDHENCSEITFEVQKLCKSGSNFNFDIDNLGTSIVRINTNGDPSSFSVPSNQKQSFKIDEIKDELELNVFIKQGTEEFSCRSVSKKFKVSDIKRC